MSAKEKWLELHKRQAAHHEAMAEHFGKAEMSGPSEEHAAMAAWHADCAEKCMKAAGDAALDELLKIDEKKLEAQVDALFLKAFGDRVQPSRVSGITPIPRHGQPEKLARPQVDPLFVKLISTEDSEN